MSTSMNVERASYLLVMAYQRTLEHPDYAPAYAELNGMYKTFYGLGLAASATAVQVAVVDAYQAAGPRPSQIAHRTEQQDWMRAVAQDVCYRLGWAAMPTPAPQPIHQFVAVPNSTRCKICGLLIGHSVHTVTPHLYTPNQFNRCEVCNLFIDDLIHVMTLESVIVRSEE